MGYYKRIDKISFIFCTLWFISNFQSILKIVYEKRNVHNKLDEWEKEKFKP